MLNLSPLPTENDEVRIRALRHDDAHDFAEGAADPAVRAFGHLPESRYTPESVVEMIDTVATPALTRGDLAVLAIADPTSDEFAGSLVLFDVTEVSAEVGFWIHPKHRGSGKARAALELAVGLASGSGLTQLTARTMTENVGAARTLAAVGFVETGRGPGTTPAGVDTELVTCTRTLGPGPDPDLPLSTSRLNLRAHRPDDAGWLHRIYSRPDVARYLLEGPWTETHADRQARERSGKTGLRTAGALALVVEADGTPIGDIALWTPDEDPRTAEIGWVLDPDHGGRGYATEAARAVLDLAFDRCGLHRVVAQMDARNTASARLADALGMRREAHLRQNWWSKGEWTDTLIFGMLSGDR